MNTAQTGRDLFFWKWTSFSKLCLHKRTGKIHSQLSCAKNGTTDFGVYIYINICENIHFSFPTWIVDATNISNSCNNKPKTFWLTQIFYTKLSVQKKYRNNQNTYLMQTTIYTIYTCNKFFTVHHGFGESKPRNRWTPRWSTMLVKLLHWRERDHDSGLLQFFKNSDVYFSCKNKSRMLKKTQPPKKTVRVPGKFCRPTVDGSEIRKQPPDMYETSNNGINYQPQLVFTPDFWTINSMVNVWRVCDSPKSWLQPGSTWPRRGSNYQATRLVEDGGSGVVRPTGNTKKSWRWNKKGKDIVIYLIHKTCVYFYPNVSCIMRVGVLKTKQ